MKEPVIKSCIICKKEFQTQYPQKRLCDQCKSQNRRDYSIRHPEQRMLTGARHRSKVEGIPFNLTREDIFIPEFCPVLGIKLECAVGEGWVSDNSPSLDKIRPELGYIKGNVVVISARANRMKSNGSLEELRKLVMWLEANQSTPVLSTVPAVSTPAVRISKKRFIHHNEETRNKMRQAQADAWASGRRGSSKLDALVKFAVDAATAGSRTFVACQKENVVGLITRFNLKGLQAKEVEGGLSVESPLDNPLSI